MRSQEGRQQPTNMPTRVRPVYEGGLAAVFQDGQPPPSANTGLWYDRYADIWSGQNKGWKPETPRSGPSVRQQFLAEVNHHLQGSGPGLAPLLAALHLRRLALWRAAGATPLFFQQIAPLNSGFGATHVLENGLVWDRNFGLPFLPASGVKGAVRVWACEWAGWDAIEADRLFGDQETHGAGAVIFHGMYPLKVPRLRLDVLNPHVKPGLEGPPGDWLSPQPVFFLTVDSGTRWVTAVQAREGSTADDVTRIVTCMGEAVAGIGLGAKTALGYGLLSRLPGTVLAQLEADWLRQTAQYHAPTSGRAGRGAGGTAGPMSAGGQIATGSASGRPALGPSPRSTSQSSERSTPAELQHPSPRTTQTPAQPRQSKASLKAKEAQRRMMERLRRESHGDANDSTDQSP